jgi:hypothetical protein
MGMVIACLKQLHRISVEEFNEITRTSLAIIRVPTESLNGRSKYKAQQDKQCT